MSTTDRTCGALLAAALESAGWRTAVVGRLRVYHSPSLRSLPAADWSVLIQTDPGHPQHDADFDTVVEELAVAERRGELAREVLERLRDEGVIA